jgi:hypothetical protein
MKITCFIKQVKGAFPDHGYIMTCAPWDSQSNVEAI